MANKPPFRPSKLQRGDRVRFNSRMRPDLLPMNVSKLGTVVKTGNMHGVWIAFDDFPDEDIFLGENELVKLNNLSLF